MTTLGTFAQVEVFFWSQTAQNPSRKPKQNKNRQYQYYGKPAMAISQ